MNDWRGVETKGKSCTSRRRKVWSSGCQGIYDILCGQAGRQVGDMLLRAVPFLTNTFCRDPAPFLSNQQYPPCLGQRSEKNNLKDRNCSKLAHSHHTGHDNGRETKDSDTTFSSNSRILSLFVSAPPPPPPPLVLFVSQYFGVWVE